MYDSNANATKPADMRRHLGVKNAGPGLGSLAEAKGVLDVDLPGGTYGTIRRR